VTKEWPEVRDKEELDREIAAIRRRLARLDGKKGELEANLVRLLADHEAVERDPGPVEDAPVTNSSGPADKIALFRALFRGREDVFPTRWENAKTGRAGYAPACANEWAPRICGKPQIKCASCPHRDFLAVTNEVIDGHLRGRHTVGVYPMLADETCWFLAADFDKATWREDSAAFLEACKVRGVPAALERSRSGQGGHVWIFFAEPVPASLARRLGAHLVTETMERNPDVGFSSYDRFFPSQDNMPAGGLPSMLATNDKVMESSCSSMPLAVCCGATSRPTPSWSTPRTTQQRASINATASDFLSKEAGDYSSRRPRSPNCFRSSLKMASGARQKMRTNF